MHWDFVITSFEPISKVTGGIGTYIRLLIEQIIDRNTDGSIRVLFLTPHVVDPDWRTHLGSDSLKVVLIDHSRTYGGGSLNYVGDEHAYFSFKVADYLETIYRSGDTFGLIEFSDYGRDGYYTIKKKRLKQIDSGTIALRLHSPDLMLFSDNRNDLSSLNVDTVYKFEQELYCFKHSDIILYGGDRMLDRVEEEVGRFGLSIRHKALKISHPFRIIDQLSPVPAPVPIRARWPSNLLAKAKSPSNRRSNGATIVYSGRLERRKGIFEFLKEVASDTELCSFIRDTNIQIVLCGKDTHTGISGGPLSNDINAVLHASNISQNVTFKGYVSQDELYNTVLPSADAFIFPSLFENYPNAFIETLPYGRPILVSERGCMPEIGSKFDFVHTYDPLSPEAAGQIGTFIRNVVRTAAMERGSSSNADRPSALKRYAHIAQEHNSAMYASYRNLISREIPHQIAEVRAHSVSFIVPHFKNIDYLENCILSIRSCMRDTDEIIVVDDCSGAEMARAAAEICRKRGAQSILLPKNRGPSHARNVGLEAAVGELVQFVDADDLLDEAGFKRARAAIEHNDDIDFIYGIAHTFGETDHLWMPRDVTTNALEQNYTHSAILIRRAVLNEVGGFDATFRYHYEDWELNARLALMGKIGEVIPYVTLHYRQKAGSRNISNQDFALLSRMQVINAVINKCDPGTFSPGMVVKLGVYLESWIRADQWIQERESYIKDLEDYKNRAVLESREIGPRTSIKISNDFSCRSSRRNFKTHIYNNNFYHQYIILFKKVVDKVSAMERKERIDFIRRSALFDSEWYLSTYTDVKNAGVDPHEHYERHGWMEDRSPNAFLSGAEVREAVGGDSPLHDEVNRFIVFAMLVE